MLDILKNDETSFLDSGTSDIEDITYYIEAIVTENGKPAVYASNTATIPGKIKAPGVALTIGNGKATLNWSKENADGYIVLMDGKPIYDTHSGSVTSYTKTGLTNYELHCFSVKAYKNINGKTAYGPKSKSVLTRDCSVILDSARTNNTRSFSLINRQGAADTTSTVYLSDNDFAIMEKFAKEHFTAGMSDFEKLVTTLDWIGQNLSYAQGSDWNKIAGRSYVDAVFNYKLGQCAQYNGTMVSMLRYLGYNANLILGWRGNAQGYKTQHLWGEVDIDGTRYIVEAGGFGASFLSPYEMSDGRYIMNNKNAPWQELNDSYEESDFEYRAYSDAYISGYKGKDSAVKIPAVLNGAEVTLIAFDTFSDRADITSVMIPNTVKEIKSDAFKGCTGLTSIMIPTSVTSMWDGVFSNCTGLTSIILPPGVKSVGASTFSGCTGLKSITLPDGITKIYDKTFWDCSSLESITIPEGVKEIGYGAFLRCASLTSVTIPGSVEKIRDSAFQNCVGLTSIKIPDGVKIIEEETFQGCSGLISVTIPNSVTSIENQAFYECTGLADITIPDSVTKIGTHVFTWCENIQATYKGNTYDYEHIDDLYKAING